MMQDVNIEKPNKDSRTVEIGQLSNELNLDLELVPPPTSGNSVVETHSNFGPDMSGSDMDEASEVRWVQPLDILLSRIPRKANCLSNVILIVGCNYKIYINLDLV